ncbi:MAG: hypothetical protein AB8E82_20535 [Aureispira sp.]
MSKTTGIILLLLITLTVLAHKVHQPTATLAEITDQTKVWSVMSGLGKVNVNVLYKNPQHDALKGEQLITKGITLDFQGKKTPRTSPKLTCIACHTVEKEHPIFGTMDPQSRLEHGDSMGIPFLPGAPLYGLVNRVAFFTDDYQHKFQHKHQQVLKDGHRNIRLAIQACNKVYAKGRTLDNWEVESILAYLWTLELQMGDLRVPDTIVSIIEESISSSVNGSKAVNLMRRYYPEVYPATLAPPIPYNKRPEVSPVLNSYKNGKRIYKLSCLHCHANKRFANLKLDRSQKTLKFLKKHFDTNSRYSIYDAVRYSPGSKANRSNIPHYTAQRMSDQQIQDLRFYIAQRAKMGPAADKYYGKH